MQIKREAKIYSRRLPSGNTSYRVDLGTIHGKRITKDFKTEIEAQRFASKANEELHNRNMGGLQDLASAERYEVLQCLARLHPFGVKLSSVVDFYLRYANPPKAGISVEDAVEEWVAAKRKLNRSDRYIDAALDSYLKPFCRKFVGWKVNEISAAAVERFVHAPGRNATTVSNYIRNLRVFFNFLVETEYCSFNPLAKIKEPTARSESNPILSPEETQRMLQTALDVGCNAECASIALVMFCGVRVEETQKLAWSAVNLDTRYVKLVAQIAKKGRRRVNPIPENAYEWLKRCVASGTVAPRNYQKRLQAIRNRAGVAYSQNAMRHSFASYHIALYQNAPQTACLLGHPNPFLLYNTYRELTTREKAIEFWSILPR
jgi:site-specific recombinase XerC